MLYRSAIWTACIWLRNSDTLSWCKLFCEYWPKQDCKSLCYCLTGLSRMYAFADCQSRTNSNWIRAGWTCLHYAVYYGHSNIVAELLRFSASKGFLKALLNRQVSVGSRRCDDTSDAVIGNWWRDCIARGICLWQQKLRQAAALCRRAAGSSWQVIEWPMLVKIVVLLLLMHVRHKLTPRSMSGPVLQAIGDGVGLPRSHDIGH